jgi:hypothetical protein
VGGDDMVPERFKDFETAIYSLQNRVRLAAKILDDKVEGLANAEEQDFIFGIISVLNDVDSDLEFMAKKPYTENPPD